MIIFANRWGSDRLNTWSGTPNGILNALRDKLGDKSVEEVTLGENKVLNAFERFAKGVLKFFKIDNCDVCAVIADSIDLRKKLKNHKNEPVIVFKEVVNKDISEDSYLFIDCSVDYAFRCHKHHEALEQYVPFVQIRKHSLLAKRNDMAEKFYQNCRGIFTMGEWLRKDLIANSSVPEYKVHAVGGGCNICINKIDISLKSGNKFLFVGKDFERKGGPLVLKAFERLNAQNEGKYELYVAGPEKWPLSGPIPDHVVFLGLKSQEELSAYYNLCDVFVMPSYFEAYGMVFLEALIYGLPCIGRDCCEMSYFIQPGKNGDLITGDNPNELAGKMEALIVNKKLMANVQANRQKYIEQYSWNAVVDRICQIIREDGYRM